MSADDSLKNWQVEEGGKGAGQYELSGAEKGPPRQLQLQEDAAAGSQWQPIDYRRQAGPRRNWILPSVVIVALLGVLAYVGWIAFGQVTGSAGSNPIAALTVALTDIIGGQAAAAPTPAAPAAVAAATTTAAEEPTATAEEPTATPVTEPTATPSPEPSPTPAMAELITGTVIEPAGVNARKEPSTDAEIVRLLAQNEPVTVVANQDGWLQVILNDNQLAWVSADFIQQQSEMVLATRINEIRAAVGLPPLELPAAVQPAGPGGIGITLPAVVIGEPGINARDVPDLVTGVMVMQLAKDTPVNAVGRNGDSQWLAVELPEGGYGWVLTQFVSLQGDVATLNVVTPADLAALVQTAAATPAAGADLQLAPTPTAAPVLPVLTLSPATPPEPFTNTLPLGAAVAISDVLGVNARATPSAEGALVVIVPNGAVLPAVSRSEDGQWIQVRLPDDRLAWMARTVINVSDNIDTLPAGGIENLAPTPAPVAAETQVAGATPAAPVVVPADAAIATVTNQLGANLRSVPDRNADPVVTVQSGETYPAIGRTEDGAWVQLALPDGTTGWAIAGTVSLDAEINSLPVTQ